MRSAFALAVINIGIGATVAGLCYSHAQKINEAVGASAIGVSDYSAVMQSAAEARSKKKRFESDGAEKFTYQLAVAERQSLPRRFERCIAEQSVTPLYNDYKATSFEIRFADTPLRALKLLDRIERDFPELRAHTMTWSGQSDGLASVVAVYELWTIPAPIAAKT